MFAWMLDQMSELAWARAHWPDANETRLDRSVLEAVG